MTQEKLKEYLKWNLSIHLSSETNDFMTTDGSRSTRIAVVLEVEGEHICESSLTI